MLLNLNQNKISLFFHVFAMLCFIAVINQSRAEENSVAEPLGGLYDAIEPKSGEEEISLSLADVENVAEEPVDYSNHDFGDVEATHPPLRLTPDKSELVRLEEDVASIIVGNPDHANVLMDNPKLLVVVPHIPGATYFSALDADGEVIMQRHIIVASPKKNYFRVRRTCALTNNDCKGTAVYYCPGMCHEISVAQPKSNANAGAQNASDGISSPNQPSSSGSNDDTGMIPPQMLEGQIPE